MFPRRSILFHGAPPPSSCMLRAASSVSLSTVPLSFTFSPHLSFGHLHLHLHLHHHHLSPSLPSRDRGLVVGTAAAARMAHFLLLVAGCLLSLVLPSCSAPASAAAGNPTVHDELNPPEVTNPTMPITVPSTNPAPTIITVPSTNPTITIPSLNPLPTPITTPSTDPSTTYPLPTPSTSVPAAPVTNPVTTPSTFPPSAPLTNPATNPMTPTISTPPPAPVTTPVPVTSPVVSGQQVWCVAKAGSMETALQDALDYACGIGGADCSPIQPSGSCYYPNTLEAHASYAFNSYFQRNPTPSSCEFGGTAVLVNANPSSGSCVLASSLSSPSSSTAGYIPASTMPSPSSTSPVTSASGSDPGSSVLNASGSGLSGSSDFPEEANTGNGWCSILPSCWSWAGLFSMLALLYIEGML